MVWCGVIYLDLLKVSRDTLKHFTQRITQLYEQGADSVRIGEYVRHWCRWLRAGVKLQSMVFKESKDVGELVIDKCVSWSQLGVLTLTCDRHTEGFVLITNQGFVPILVLPSSNLK